MTNTDGQSRDEFPLLELFKVADSRASHLVLSTLRVASLLDRVVARSLAPFGLHHAQFNALLLLKKNASGGLRPSALGDYLCVSRPNVTKLLARLKSRGLIEERPDPDDGRAVLAIATAAGTALAEQASEMLTRDLEAAVDTLASDDAMMLQSLLDRFRDGLAGRLVGFKPAGAYAVTQSTTTSTSSTPQPVE